MLDKMSRLIKNVGNHGKAAELVAEADARRDERDWERAAELYKSALEADPTMAHIWVQYGHALKESGAISKAEEAYRQALAIDAESADAHVQLGHLLKIADRTAEAIVSYRKALQLTPNDLSVKKEIEACKKNLGTKFFSGSGACNIYFDVSDLIFYIGHHNNLTGIQRVQAAIVLGLLDAELNDVSIHFLTYVNSQASFYEIDQKFFISLLNDLSLDSDSRQVHFDKPAARDGYIRETVPFKTSSTSNNVFCLLGAAWVNRDYFLRVRNLKQNGGFRVLFLIHDLIPIFARETCDQGTAEVFTSFLLQSHQVVDQYLCVSQNTRNDLIRYFSGLGWTIPEPIITQNGSLSSHSGISQPSVLKAIDFELEPGNFILFVSTIEGRKNHIGAFKAFESLLATRSDVPFLVCVGRLGWRAEDFLLSCELSEFLRGKIKILSDISDEALIALYQNCLLTIYPSLYEGWGLPVGEALAFGKVCITSTVSSLPEAGGDFAHYIDPLQPAQLADAIARFLDNPASLKDAETRIRERYKPIEWKDVGSRIVTACLSSLDEPLKSPLPELELGREYAVGNPPQIPKNLMGEQMVEAIAIARSRFFLPGLYKEDDYRLGNGARIGEGWCEPELSYTWARANNANLAFSLREPIREKLVLYLAYQTLEPCLGRQLIVEASRSQAVSFNITQLYSYVVLQGLTPIATPEGGIHCFIRFRINGAEEVEERLREIDRRSPAFAIRSFVILPESAVAARMNLLERLYFMKQ